MNGNLMLNMMLNQLKSVNPSGYNQVIGYMNSGKNPEAILDEMLKSGRVSQADIDKAKSYLKGMN